MQAINSVKGVCVASNFDWLTPRGFSGVKPSTAVLRRKFQTGAALRRWKRDEMKSGCPYCGVIGMDQLEHDRSFMKSSSFANEKNRPATDRQHDVPHPPLGKPATNEIITLPDFSASVPKAVYADLLNSRRSLRSYADTPVTQEKMTFLL